MRLLSLSEASIQPRTSLPQFLWNGGPKQESHPSWGPDPGQQGVGPRDRAGACTGCLQRSLSRGEGASIPVSQYPSIFPGFVLGSIDASDSERGLIFSHFSRSTELSYWIFRISLIFTLFCKISLTSLDFAKCCWFSSKSIIFCRIFLEILLELREIQ